MPTFIYDRASDRMVEVTRGPRQPSKFPMITRDIPAYVSPLGTGVIDGRTARREEMKRHNVREVDPSERAVRVKEPDWLPDYRAGKNFVRSNPNE